jgi:hypothetical protein
MKKTLSITILLLTIFQVFGQNKKLLIKNVNIIPLHINQEWNNKDVLIEDGIIREIREQIKNDTTKYDLGVIDGNGKYLIPSFADAHSHLPEKENLNSYFLMNLINGVTTLRSMRGEMWHLEIDKNDELTPKLILSSPPISRRNDISEEDANKLITDYKKSGFDFAKILSVKDEQTFDNLVASANSEKFHFAGHCPSNIGLLKVIKSNVFQSVEHLGGFFQLPSLDEINSAINLSISNKVYHCATLDWYFTGQVPEDELRKRDGVKFLPTELVNSWESKISAHYEKTTENEREIERKESKDKFQARLKYLKYIYTQGGKLLLSPDASGIYGIPGYGIHIEMQHYKDAGISNFDILKATCYNLSEMLSTQNDWGTIKVGAKSDMVLLDENPLKDIGNTEKINGVIFKGKFYSISDLENKLNAKKR